MFTRQNDEFFIHFFTFMAYFPVLKKPFIEKL